MTAKFIIMVRFTDGIYYLNETDKIRTDFRKQITYTKGYPEEDWVLHIPINELRRL